MSGMDSEFLERIAAFLPPASKWTFCVSMAPAFAARLGRTAIGHLSFKDFYELRECLLKLIAWREAHKEQQY